MLVVGSFVIFLAAVALIGVFTLQAFRYAARAMSKRRTRASRIVAGAIAVAAGLAILASGAGGFLGITALWYSAQVRADLESPP